MVLDRKIAFIHLDDNSETPLNWGDGETILMLIHSIAQRKGFGHILAEGPFAKDIALPVFGEKAYHCDLCGGKPSVSKSAPPEQ